MEHSSALRPITGRFVAGLDLEHAINVAVRLRAEGMLATLDRLGENVTNLGEAAAARVAYVAALNQIKASSLESSVSVKVTSLGLDISERQCLENAATLVEIASGYRTRVEFDMESSAYTDRTLRIVEQLNARFPGCVRAVIQAYLYRSPADVQQLSRLNIPVRLCKGAYQESASVAFAAKSEVDGQYLTLAKELLANGTYPAIATHDIQMIEGALSFVQANSIPADGFEFQMLYGVRRDLQKRIVERGYQLRLYVPYGEAWYPYFMRRLAERPANVLFLLKSLGHE